MSTGKLTALKVRNLTKPGRYGDGGGLWLQVRDAERRSWLFRFAIQGRERQMGLGPLEDVPLAEARLAAAECRRQMRQGADPIVQRAEARTALRAVKRALTFQDVAERYIAAHEASWRNQKHRDQWQSSLKLYAFGPIGSIPVDRVSTADVMKVIEPIWFIKPETAGRIRGRIESVLDYAKAREWRAGENPARWRGHVANMLPKRGKVSAVRHHSALPCSEITPFMATLSAEPGLAAIALQFVILTAARTSEAIEATWTEIDLERGVWTVPASRMKAGREHRVPLVPLTVGLLRGISELRTEASQAAFVFPGSKPGRSLSNMSMSMLLRRMKRADLTVHGFRSTFRDWAAEATSFPREVAEAALAHTLDSKVEAAYRRSDLFEKRRGLMEEWAMLCEGVPIDRHAPRKAASSEAA